MLQCKHEREVDKMFNFGDKVIVLDRTLKSHRKVGLYCGQNDKGLAKVYLREPIESKNSKVHCITIAEEKIALYCENPLDFQKKFPNRFAFLEKWIILLYR